jgi:pimeloyl-ACP methyl ester carboxylesterase
MACRNQKGYCAMTLIHRTVRVRDTDIRLTESNGSGLPVVLIHGSGSNRQIFDKQLHSPLADRFRLVAMDLPGHGESGDAANPATDYTLPGLAGSVGDVLAALDIGRAAFFGWSLGGHIAIELASTSSVVAGMMISGAPPIGHGPIGTLLAFRITFDSMLASKENFTDADVVRFARLCFGENVNDDHLRAIRRADGRMRKIMFGSMMSGRCADEKKFVQNSPTPVAMVNGADDPFFRQRYVAALRYARLWDGYCHVIPDAGHAAFSEKPEIFNAMLMRFCDELASGRLTMGTAGAGKMPAVQTAELLRESA